MNTVNRLTLMGIVSFSKSAQRCRQKRVFDGQRHTDMRHDYAGNARGRIALHNGRCTLNRDSKVTNLTIPSRNSRGTVATCVFSLENSTLQLAESFPNRLNRGIEKSSVKV